MFWKSLGTGPILSQWTFQVTFANSQCSHLWAESTHSSQYQFLPRQLACTPPLIQFVAKYAQSSSELSLFKVQLLVPIFSHRTNLHSLRLSQPGIEDYPIWRSCGHDLFHLGSWATSTSNTLSRPNRRRRLVGPIIKVLRRLKDQTSRKPLPLVKFLCSGLKLEPQHS